MSRVLANASAPDRSPVDDYETPEDVTTALLNFLQLDSSVIIWECACSHGRMTRVMQKRGHAVFESDLFADGMNLDFVTAPNTYDCNWIITNPPFSRAEEFIRHAAALKVDGFAFLLKSQFWHAAKRRRLFFETNPAFVLPLTWRPDFLFGAKSGAPTMDVLWTVWTKHRGGTVYEPLPKPRQA